MQPPVSTLLFAVLLLAGMLILLEMGRRLGIRRVERVRKRARQFGDN